MSTDKPTLLPGLEEQLREAARRTQPRTLGAQAARAAARSPRRRLLVVALAVVLLLASAAVAAVTTGIVGTGAPAPHTTGLGVPYHQEGRVLPGQGTALTLTVSDPDGGLRWGLRTYGTSRKAACWQVGRVLGGQLGVLGRDGLLKDDGLFHPLTPTVDRCTPLDGAGRLYVAQEDLALDNGVQDRLTCEPKDFGNDPSRRDYEPCPDGSMRALFYGFLGPAARSVTASGPGLATEPVALARDGSGAYLYVLKLGRAAQWLPLTLTARYADGTTRDVNLPAPTRVATKLPSPAALRTPLRVTHRRLGKNTNYTVSFRAPVAVKRFGLEYHVAVDGPARGDGPTCGRPLHTLDFGTPDNVRRGERLGWTITPGIALRYDRGWCPGTYRVTVVLQDRAHPVGSFTFRAR